MQWASLSSVIWSSSGLSSTRLLLRLCNEVTIFENEEGTGCHRIIFRPMVDTRIASASRTIARILRAWR